MKEIQKSESPSRDKDLTAIKMLVENIGYQYSRNDNKQIYTVEDIAKFLTTEEQVRAFSKFKHIQVELVHLINRANRLYNSLSDITVTMFVLFKNKEIASIINKERITLEWARNSIIESTKELVVMANILEKLGQIWGVKPIEDLGAELNIKTLDNISVISIIEELGLKYEVPLLEEADRERIGEELKRVDISAPILLGYYNGFSEYEDEVRVWHGEE